MIAPESITHEFWYLLPFAWLNRGVKPSLRRCELAKAQIEVEDKLGVLDVIESASDNGSAAVPANEASISTENQHGEKMAAKRHEQSKSCISSNLAACMDARLGVGFNMEGSGRSWDVTLVGCDWFCLLLMDLILRIVLLVGLIKKQGIVTVTVTVTVIALILIIALTLVIALVIVITLVIALVIIIIIALVIIITPALVIAVFFALINVIALMVVAPMLEWIVANVGFELCMSLLT